MLSISRVFPLLIIGLVLACPVLGYDLFSDDFENSPVGAKPVGWKLAGSIAGTSANVVAGWSGNSTHVVQLHDSNGADGSDPTKNNTLHTSFPKALFGKCTLQFDANLASIHAGFGARITNGDVPTNGSNWIGCVVFEGDIPYNFSGAAPGTLSYETRTGGGDAYTNTGVSYSAATWYTVKIEANLDTRMYKIFFGPKGGALSEATPAGGVPFIYNTSGGQATQAGGVTFFTSKQTSGGVGEPSGDMYIDNVLVTCDVPIITTVGEAKTSPKYSVVQLLDKVVTADANQLGKPFFYIQDETGGIRVRSGECVVQGDLVSVEGTIQRASDNGTVVLRNGEREILASGVQAEFGAHELPNPVGMKNRDVGGGPLFADPPGPLDTDGYPFQPGVWASSTGASSGYDQISECGSNNVARLVKVWGWVVYADDTNRFFYINDGSDVHDGSALPGNVTPPPGIRVLAPTYVPLTNIVGKYAVITGLAGSISQAEVGSPKGPTGGNYIRNCRIIRPVCEPFADVNLNGFWDSGEDFVDMNASGAYDGIVIAGVPGPSFISAFDHYGTMMLRGAPFMPKGIYVYSPDPAFLDEQVSQGFNTITCFDAMGPSVLPSLNARNLYVLPCLRNPADRAGWMAVKDDPAIIGWYDFDEPEGTGVSPAAALEAYNWIKEQDPYHVAGNSHFLWEAITNYKDSEEFTLSDRYPINGSGTGNIVSIADHVVQIQNVNGAGHPAYHFLQCFDEPPTFGLPTPTQLRAMMYLALAYHAKGIFVFSYQRPANPGWPAAWAEVRTLNSELDMWKPFLTLPYTPLNASTSNGDVRIGGFRVGNSSALIITVNVTPNPVTSTFHIPGITATSLPLPLEGSATQSLVNGYFTYTYQPYQTRVMLWGSIPPAP